MAKKSDTMRLINPDSWEVTEEGEGKKAVWMLKIECYLGIRRIVICGVDRTPWELAVDAALDWIDRLREGRIPRDLNDPHTLMAICVSAARRQR